MGFPYALFHCIPAGAILQGEKKYGNDWVTGRVVKNGVLDRAGVFPTTLTF